MGKYTFAVVPLPDSLSSTNVPLMVGDDSADDREPEAAAVGPREPAPRELAPDDRQLVRRDADAAILHLDDDVLSFAARRNADEVFARRVADRVVDQVVERQHHRRAVRPDERADRPACRTSTVNSRSDSGCRKFCSTSSTSSAGAIGSNEYISVTSVTRA